MGGILLANVLHYPTKNRQAECKYKTSNACQHCVARFDNMWFLLCLEILCGHWSATTWLLLCLEVLLSDCFCCTWLLLSLEILHADWFPGGGGGGGI